MRGRVRRKEGSHLRHPFPLAAPEATLGTFQHSWPEYSGGAPGAPYDRSPAGLDQLAATPPPDWRYRMHPGTPQPEMYASIYRPPCDMDWSNAAHAGMGSLVVGVSIYNILHCTLLEPFLYIW